MEALGVLSQRHPRPIGGQDIRVQSHTDPPLGHVPPLLRQDPASDAAVVADIFLGALGRPLGKAALQVACPLPTGDGYIKGAIVSLSLDMEQMFHNHMALGRELIQP